MGPALHAEEHGAGDQADLDQHVLVAHTPQQISDTPALGLHEDVDTVSNPFCVRDLHGVTDVKCQMPLSLGGIGKYLGDQLTRMERDAHGASRGIVLIETTQHVEREHFIVVVQE